MSLLIRPRIKNTCLCMLCAFASLVCSQTQASDIELVAQTTVDARSLTFATGPATRFSNTVNGRTHQQSPLTTYRGYQYVTYVDAERRICLGRRKLPNGQWDVIQFRDHLFESNDSHNTAVLGICEKDGTIHLAFDHHASQLNYRVSKLGAAHNPQTVEWNVELFGPVAHTLGSVSTHERVTYPRFFRASNGNLMLYYRAVTSGNGDGVIEEYDGNIHDWTPGLGKFISRDHGKFTLNGKTSHYRNPYMNSLSYAGDRLHVSWVWRDRFEKTNPRNQHDLCYAYSDDHGRTWLNSAGKIIGKTGEDAIHLNSPGLVVAPIPCNRSLANSNSHYTFADGSIHVVMRHRSPGSRQASYHHYWRQHNEGFGIEGWRNEVLPFTGDRPKLVGMQNGTLVLVYTDDEHLHIALGQRHPRKPAYRWNNVSLPRRHSIYGDAVLDLERWEKEQVLSIYSQEAPKQQIRTKETEPVDGVPAPLHVVDYRLSNLDASQE